MISPLTGRNVKYSLSIALILTALSSVSQHAEIGFGVGGFKYFGDLSRGISIKSISPGGNLYYRSNINNEVSFRGGITAGKLTGSDASTPIDPFSENRNTDFSIFIFEASTVFEYHFLKWRQENSIIRWTPYLFGGIGIFGVSGMEDKSAEYSSVQPSIPFGFGFKYVLNPKWYIGLEIGFRKTFFDYLDNIGPGNGVSKDYNYGNRFDNDHYSFFGVSMTYSFYDIPCPTDPYKRNYRR